MSRRIRRLLRAAGAGNADALAAAWQAWFGDRSDRLLARLTGLPVPVDADLVGRICGHAVAAPDSAVAAFCVEHDLVPDDAGLAARLWLLTGRVDRYAAADPDGGLLTPWYAATDAYGRHTIRAALVDAGLLDRLAALTRTDPNPGTGRDEAGWAARELAGRRDWAALWRLTRRVPLAHALELVAEFPPGWRPEEAAGRFAALRAAPPDVLTTDRATAAELGRVRRRRGEPGGYTEAMFSTDGSYLAVCVGPWQRGYGPGTVTAYALPSLDRLWRNAEANSRLLLATPTGVLAARSPGHPVPAGAVWVTPDGAAEVAGLPVDGTVVAGAPPDGVVAVGDGGTRLYYAPAGRGPVGGRPLTDLGITPTRYRPEVASDPGTGRFAIGIRPGLVLCEPDGSVVARADPAEDVHGLAVTGPDRVVTTSPVGMSVHRVDGDRLRSVTSTMPGTRATPVRHWPGLGIEVLLRSYPNDRSTWLGLPDLTRSVRLTAPFGERDPGLVPSPDGRWFADTSPSDGLVVYQVDSPPWLDELVDRPAADLTPADLDRVEELAERAIQPAVRTLLDLLRLGIADQYAHAITLADAGPVTDPDGIEVGGGGPR